MKKIPKTSKECPYIEFRYSKRGVLRFRATAHWYGGKYGSYVYLNGDRGNAAPPDELGEYMRVFRDSRIREIRKRIKDMERELEWYLGLDMNDK